MFKPESKNELRELVKTVKDLNTIDTSLVTNMCSMFYNANLFNQPLNEWDVSNVTNMSQMFWFAESFNQPLNDWDVSNVKDMCGMFTDAVRYSYSMSKWKLRNDCTTILFFKNCIMWFRFNNENDIPLGTVSKLNAIL